MGHLVTGFGATLAREIVIELSNFGSVRRRRWARGAAGLGGRAIVSGVAHLGTLRREAPRGESGRRRWEGLFWLVGAVSAGLAALRVLLEVHRSPLDFDIYMMGASHFFGGHLYAVRYPSPQLGFTYPPFSALAFGPLDLVPRQAAQYLWAVGNIVLLAALVAVSLRAARPTLSVRRIVQWSLALMTPVIWLDPVGLTFAYGQVNIVLALLVLVDLTTTVRRGRWVLPEGVLTGLAAAAKLTPLVFVPFLFLVRRGRSATTALATFAGVALVVAALGPSTSWEYWTRYAFDTGRVGSNSYISNQSLSGAFERLHHGVVSHAAYYGADLIVAVAGMGLAVWAYRRSSPLLGILVCATVGMVVSPITWVHHMVWVVPALAWLCLAEDRPVGGWMWAAGAALLFWIAPVWSVPHGGSGQELHEHGFQLVVGNSYFVAMLAFLIGVAAMLSLRTRHPDRHPARARSGTPPPPPRRRRPAPRPRRARRRCRRRPGERRPSRRPAPGPAWSRRRVRWERDRSAGRGPGAPELAGRGASS